MYVKQNNDELTSLLIARDRYRQIAKQEPKPYDKEVLEILDSHIDYYLQGLDRSRVAYRLGELL